MGRDGFTDGGRRVPIPIGVLGWCPDATWQHPQRRSRGTSREHPQGPRRPQRTHDPARPGVSRPFPAVGWPFPVARSVLAGLAATVIGSLPPWPTGAVAGGLVPGLAVLRRG
jgi:hypothetical protein